MTAEAHAIAAAKADLRRMMRAKRRAIAPDERIAGASALAGHAALIAGFAGAGVVSGFDAFGSEIDPEPLLMALAASGTPIALPRMAGDGLTFHRFLMGDALQRSPLGPEEPLADAPVADPAVMLTPLLAFDRAGRRLGYGKGYYDRAIVRLPHALAIGVAFAAQEVEAVPVGPFDLPLDFVLTEHGLIDCRAQRGQ